MPSKKFGVVRTIAKPLEGVARQTWANRLIAENSSPTADKMIADTKYAVKFVTNRHFRLIRHGERTDTELEAICRS